MGHVKGRPPQPLTSHLYIEIRWILTPHHGPWATRSTYWCIFLKDMAKTSATGLKNRTNIQIRVTRSIRRKHIREDTANLRLTDRGSYDAPF